MTKIVITHTVEEPISYYHLTEEEQSLVEYTGEEPRIKWSFLDWLKDVYNYYFRRVRIEDFKKAHEGVPDYRIPRFLRKI